ncbi:MAG TPA: D-glycero-beta-D-manno-heptose 1,7-bisphosphate 7-phosphatase, partial [Geobacteraceae bacterium]
VFLDRDGTINVEREFLHRPDEFLFIPGAPQAIRLFNDAGFRVIVVTNQSGIARGYYGATAVHELHRYVDGELERFGATIDAYYFCPHHPEFSADAEGRPCRCRKPGAGMLLEAAADFSLDLAASYIIGDKIVDIQAGLNAGCRPILVRTGYGAAEAALLPQGIAVFADLLCAARAIVENRLTG